MRSGRRRRGDKPCLTAIDAATDVERGFQTVKQLAYFFLSEGT